jgi:hypothetical protein
MPFDLAEPFIVAAEQALGAILPATYREAMKASNGGEVVIEDDDWLLFPIADTSDRKRLSRTANHIVAETKACREWPRFPLAAVAIADNGGGDRLVFLREGDRFLPTVYVWSHETAELRPLAGSFDALPAD